MLKVIVVDDEPLARKGMMVRLREFAELDVIAECSNGQQAIETITSLAPDLVFLDVEMPGMDGFETLKTIQFNYSTIGGPTVYYPNSTKPVLSDVVFKAKSNEHILITGKNSSGKSTFLHVLAGLFDLQDGTISYNGIPRDNLKLDSLRSIIGGCLVEEALFEGSLLENINMGRDGATFENVKWAVKGVGLEEFVKKLPKGYETILEPLGKKLPKSIAQRILIARAIADKPKLLLLEYAFEHLDLVERKKIVDFLMDKSNNWTIVAVSNDDYIAQKADKIGIMENGTIAHFGTYKELSKIANLKSYKDA